ncbi:MAG: hypothetical protein COA69_10150 [Robiginitomaculum sp.]|nr:MAG: hypothetical protein COA69_10150 [Robiginitomaculum sp.]
MLNFKPSISTLAIGAVLSTSLVLGGCNKKPDVSKSEEIVLKDRTVSETDAVRALKLMGLDVSGSNEFVWAARSGSAGNYTYTDIVRKDEDDGVTGAGSLELRGVHMEGDQPAFDQLVLKNFQSKDDDALISFKTITLTEPTAALAGAIGLVMGGDEDAFDDMEGDVAFSAISFSGLKVSGDDGVLTLDGVKLAKTADGKGIFTFDNLDMDMTDNGKSIKMKLGAINVVGVNIDKYKDMVAAMVEEGKAGEGFDEKSLKALVGSMNPYDPDFENFSLTNFNMNAQGLIINLDSLTGTAKKKGGKTIMSQTMSPLTITPPKETTDKDMIKFNEAMATLGYDALEFTMEQNSVLDEAADSMIVKDSYIAMKDGFNLSFDYDMLGYKAYLEAAIASTANANMNPMDAMAMMEAFKIKSMRIALRDDSIVERAFKLAAKQQGGTPAALKNQAKMGLAFLPMMAQDEGQQKIASELSTALGAWLENSGTLVFDMKPETPVSIGEIGKNSMNGDFDAASLGLTITHEE